MRRFRVTVILWVLSIYATALSAYTPGLGLVAATSMVMYWWSVVRWHEDESEVLKISIVITITVRLLEPFAPQEPHQYRIISLGLFVLFSILPAWRKREPWYDQYF